MPESTSKSLAGVWSRQWEEDPLGDTQGVDRITLVLWTQSAQSGVYVDVRLPIDSPGRLENAQQLGIKPNPAALAATGASKILKSLVASNTISLPTLLRQKSFAGVLDYQNGDTTSGDALKKDKPLAELASCDHPDAIKLCTCFWRRDLDYQPPSGGPDVGVCASGPPAAADGSILLRETGEDASYAEGWLRSADTAKGPFLALKLLAENDHVNAREGYWVRAGRCFAYAVGRPETAEVAEKLGCHTSGAEIQKEVGKTLSEAVNNTTTDPDLALDIAFSYVACAGEINEEEQWKIHHSTNPELVGCLLVSDQANKELSCSQIVCISSDDKQVEQIIRGSSGKGVTRRWQIVEQSRGSKLPFFLTVPVTG